MLEELQRDAVRLARGYVLAGGASSRFGSSKARALYRGTPLILHAAAVLEEVCDEVTAIAAPGADFSDLGLRTIQDVVPGRGPLSGLHTALVDAADGMVVLTACDFLGGRASWLKSLLHVADEGRAAAFRDDTRWHPLFAIYSTELCDEVRRRLDAQNLSVQALLDAVGNPVAPPDGFERARSIDTPKLLEEYADDQ